LALKLFMAKGRLEYRTPKSNHNCYTELPKLWCML